MQHDIASSVDVNKSNSILQAASGCRYNTTIHEPTHKRKSLALVLGHGFLRSQSNMRELADAIAEAGFAVTTLDFCNMKPWNGQHQKNALEMIATAKYWGFEKVVYAGFSAGALAALLAAARDDKTQGLILLDFSDRSNIGKDALQHLTAPVYALNGEPSRCNTQIRNVEMFASEITIEKIDRASHCAFESPTGWVCRMMCGANNSVDNQARGEINRRIVDALIRLNKTGRFSDSDYLPDTNL